MTNSAIAIACGIMGSVLFHLAKGMQRHGIDAVAFLLSRAGSRRRTSAGHVALYMTGFVLNNSLGLFAILANRYAPSSYFTSMFGSGLIVLMLYARFALKETLHPLQYGGALVLGLGTALLGIDGSVRPELTMARINLFSAGLVTVGALLLAALLIAHARRARNSAMLGAAWGLAVGLAASLDPLLKGVGQNLGTAGRFLPSRPLGWIIFLGSFAFATLSFAASQWVFSRGVRASLLVPSQSFAYIVFPVLFQSLALPGFKMTALTVGGLLVACLGLAAIQAQAQRD